MFKDLHAVARHTPLNLIITPDGARLRVIVMPRPTGEAKDNAALAKHFSAIGTPEELDVEFPAALARYSSAVNELRAALDLPLDALEEAKKKAAKKDAAKAETVKKKEAESQARSAAAKKAAAKRAATLAEQKKAKAAKLEATRKAREDSARKRRAALDAKNEAARAARKAKKITLPGATAPAAKLAKGAATKRASPLPPASAPMPSASSSRHLASKPGKPECIADWRALNAKEGDALTRRRFIKLAKTGRRYEKLWKNWEAFVAEAKGFAVAPGDRITEHGTVVTQQPLKTVDDWPFPTGSRIADGVSGDQTTKKKPNSGAARQSAADVPPPPLHAAEPAAPEPAAADDAGPMHGKGQGNHTDVYDTELKYLSSITTKPAIGEHIALASQPKLLRVLKIETRASGGLDIIVTPDAEETARRAADWGDQMRRVQAEAQELQPAQRVIPLKEVA